jgi:TPR repeat protein
MFNTRKLFTLLRTFTSKCLFVLCFAFFLTSCATVKRPQPDIQAHLASGKRAFQQGHYKTAMYILLPLACDGIAEAQYAVGYMHYYGYGVIEDKQVGCIWIERAAHLGYPPAVEAIKMIKINGD